MSNLSEERASKGLYWQRAWKLVEGCTKVSPGCENCWSEAETGMRANNPNKIIKDRAEKVLRFVSQEPARFSGQTTCREDNLDLPLRTKKPTVFAIWNDLYHEDVPDDFRDSAYAVMALCPQHVFLVLTKRAEGMAEYMNERGGSPLQWVHSRAAAEADPDMWGWVSDKALAITPYNLYLQSPWPLPNVWHGVTAENQAQADGRIPHLLTVPGKRFLSIEPMLSAIGLVATIDRAYHKDLRDMGVPPQPASDLIKTSEKLSGIHAVLLGGESGKSARPMHPQWARDVRDQCAAASVPFYFKQWGEWLPGEKTDDSGTAYRSCSDGKIYATRYNPPRQNFGTHTDPHSGSMITCRVGKRNAGRTLDGRLHDDLPWRTS